MEITRKLIATPSLLVLIALAVACSSVACSDSGDTGGFSDASTHDAAHVDSGSADATADATTLGDAGAVEDASDASDASHPDATAPDASDASSIPDTSDEDADHSIIPPGATIGTCVPSQWTLVASDSASVNPIAYALDSLPPTRWSTGAAQSFGQFLQIDFGGYVLLDSLTFDNSFSTKDESDYARGFDVLASDDGATFLKTVTTQSFQAADPGPVVTVTFPKYAVRALRVVLNASSGSWWSIHELRVGCATPPPAVPDAGADADAEADAQADAGADADPDAQADAGADADPDAQADAGADADPDASTSIDASDGIPLDRTGWTATASDTSANDPIASAFDGNPATRWATGKVENGDEWFRIDLGAAATIHEVLLQTNATDYPSAYQLEVSTDDVSYTTVTTGLGAPTTKITFAPRSARYVRIKQIGTGYDKWWCIYEASIFQ